MRLTIIGTLDGQIGAASKIARKRGAEVTQFSSLDEALDALRGGQGADLVMVDVTLDVATLIRSLKQERIHVEVIGCGCDSDSDAAVRAIKAGAKEYLPLPPDEDLIAAVLEAITREDHTLIHQSQAIREVLRLADQVAGSDASVLITGESGTGKEVIARYIHQKSKRTKQKMISVNCAAIPDNLLESELFGHEKGAFTGALARRVGKFEEANKGTLLLDEISEMDLRLQAKLLRAIQEKEIDRVGGSSPVSVDIRILATSNRDLQQEVDEGNFREDLYFRLNVIRLHLPSLRERTEDILPLAKHFIDKYSKANGIAVRPLGADTEQALLAHSWRGNVRELENAMHRAVLLAQGKQIDLDAVMLPVSDGAEKGAISPENAVASDTDSTGLRGAVGRPLASVERDLILETLDHCLGNRTHAANILGISIRTLRNKLKQYGDEHLTEPRADHG